MRIDVRQTLLIALTTVGFAASGCSSALNVDLLKQEKPPTKAEEFSSGPTKVMVDGTALALGQPEADTVVRERFVQHFGELVEQRAIASARKWVAKHPDLAVESLRDAAAKPQPIHLQLAQIYDDAFSIAPGAARWQDAFRAVATNPEAFAAYDKARSDLMLALRDGRFDDASRINLVGAANSTGQQLLVIDAWQWTAVSLMVADQHVEAVEAFQQAQGVANSAAPQMTPPLLLLSSEARRRAGDINGANNDWAAAVSIGSQMVASAKPITDPTFWDRALYLQPVGIEWPPAVAANLAQIGSASQLPAALAPVGPIVLCSFRDTPQQSVPVTLWSCIGQWRMDRGDAQNALLAFKRAEALSSSLEVASWLRLEEAKAMMMMEQTPAATAILVKEASRKDGSPSSLAAMSELGVQRVHGGAVNQGLALLRESLEANPDCDWPGRAAAESDLGLSYLLVGDETSGLRWLHKSRERFKAAGDVEAVAQSLWNEARYFENAKNNSKVKELEAECLALQQ